jgi:hypothetical protein
MTVWPAAPLGPFVVTRHDFALGADGTLQVGDRLGPIELPDEWLLRDLADADLDHDDAVLALLNEYGGPSIYGVRPRFKVRPWFGIDWIADPRVWEELEKARLRQEYPKPLEDARWWLKAARAIGRTWARASWDEDISEPWLTEGFADPVGRSFVPKAGYRGYFQSSLNVGLEVFAPRVVDDIGSRPLETNLYSAACAQVFNLMVEGATARLCANETCERTFVHQLGGARFDQHRNVGVRYCSPACARAEASRQYRRRKAAKEDKS